ncbi:MAG: ABC transporter substrate-binding protein, partial [Rhodospirillales bacterium]|nr:ABC transporter substrate-binding protein [Rhodospirillales bacterium]
MKRRQLVKGAWALGAAAAASTLSRPAIAHPAITKGLKELRMVTTWPRDFPGLGTGAERFARRVTQMSGGTL